MQASKIERPGASFVGTQPRRYKLWWQANDKIFGGVGTLVKKKISTKVMEI